ncbi:MAG TPA: hypothetical protein VE422_24390 [Terriglobia bacterium]|nr:hypothetical protein [Terriglobia bacterium]
MSKTVVNSIREVFKPQAPLWACEVTAKHVIVAGVNKKRSQIEGKVATDVTPGPENLRAGVRYALSNAGFKGSEIAVVVPDDTARIAFLTSEKPSRDPDEQKTFIRWKLKKTVPFDVETAQVAFRVLGPHRAGAGVDMLVALSPRSIVQEFEDLFDSLGIHAGMVMPSTLAALHLFNVPSVDALFLKIAPDCITTSVFQNQRMAFYRRVAEMPLYDAVYPTVMYYQDKLGGKALEQLTICGYDEDMRSPIVELQERLGLSPARLDPKNVEDIFKPVLGSVHLLWQSLI